METLFWTRVLCIVLWLAVAIALFPSFVNYLKGQYTETGELWAALFMTASLFVVSYASRIIVHEELHALIALNAFTAALAVFVLILVRQGARK